MLLNNLLFVLTIGICGLNDTEVLDYNYIENYKALAIEEMQRTGVPASIKLAQAMVESGSGTSILANRANNHFGIKCKVEWGGGKYYYMDDDFDAEGNPVASCFRSYDSALDSYRDHSDFLISRDRYHTLFKLNKTDYKGWAEGLSRCGYATDRSYAAKLKAKIEKYKLYLIDQEGATMDF